MHYSYCCATGTETVDIPEEWKKLLEAMDREEEANRKKETRRHLSLEEMDFEGEAFSGGETAETELLQKEFRRELEKELSLLTETQRRRLQMAADGMTYREIAAAEGVDRKQIFRSVEQARKKFSGKNF